MKKLFLASSFQDVAGILKGFEKDLQGKTVTFIPTASTVEKIVFYVNAGRKALEKLGMIVDELDISSAGSDEIAYKLKNNDYIYLSGGNTFFLLQELKRTGTDKRILEEVHRGKLYIGESAGAIVTGANIEYARGMDSIKKAPHLDNYDALGLVDFYTLPHYNNPPFQKAGQKIMDTYASAMKILPISNNEAILVHGKTVEVKRT